MSMSMSMSVSILGTGAGRRRWLAEETGARTARSLPLREAGRSQRLGLLLQRIRACTPQQMACSNPQTQDCQGPPEGGGSLSQTTRTVRAITSSSSQGCPSECRRGRTSQSPSAAHVLRERYEVLVRKATLDTSPPRAEERNRGVRARGRLVEVHARTRARVVRA